MSSDIEKRLQCSSLLDVHNRLIQCHVEKQNEQKLSKCDEYLLRKNHKFLWDKTKTELTWEEELAKKYYDKLFKEFCVCDLSKYKDNMVALRWRTKGEVVSGKGQFSCAERNCKIKEHLRMWEVNFCYMEDNQRKNALVKVKLCADCSYKLNYHSQKRQLKRLKHKKKKSKRGHEQKKKQETHMELETTRDSPEASCSNISNESQDTPWTQKNEVEIKSRDEEMEDYLNDLLF